MKYMLFICADPDVKLTPEQQTEAWKGTESWVKAVSYTHLTLPTICSV